MRKDQRCPICNEPYSSVYDDGGTMECKNRHQWYIKNHQKIIGWYHKDTDEDKDDVRDNQNV